jgi:hypothetical protein
MKWISNPAAYGVIHYYPDKGPAVGGVAHLASGEVRGYFGTERVYDR